MIRRNVLFYLTGTLLLIVGIGAIPAGIGLIVKPDGSALGMPIEILGKSPFEDFLIPGIILFAINGIGSLIGCILSFKLHPFAGKVTIILGFAMVIWMLAQVYWIGWLIWMQPAFLIIGVTEVFLGFVIDKK